jgi:hypothetical protein
LSFNDIHGSGNFLHNQHAVIRLTGQWLERAGFKPGNRVEIKISQPGTLTLKFLPEHDNNSLQPHSATLVAVGGKL